MAVFGVARGDGPAEEEGAAGDEPEDFHGVGEGGGEGDEEAGCEEEEGLGGFEGSFPGVETRGVGLVGWMAAGWEDGGDV